jgi:hypothetical protein
MYISFMNISDYLITGIFSNLRILQSQWTWGALQALHVVSQMQIAPYVYLIYEYFRSSYHGNFQQHENSPTDLGGSADPSYGFSNADNSVCISYLLISLIILSWKFLAAWGLSRASMWFSWVRPFR